jgi:hypothetical protein
MKSNWFVDSRFDLGFFHLPVWLCWVLVWVLPTPIRDMDVPIWVWVMAVLCIDVGHVWSTIYRTYLDPDAWQTHRWRMIWFPLFCFVPAVGLAFLSEALFWRVLAYIAVYHFIKQQVGIAMLYFYKNLCVHKGAHPNKDLAKRLDKMAVYAGTVGPVIHWHFNDQAVFHWFMAGDFLSPTALVGWLSGLPGGTTLMLVGKVALYSWWFGLPLVWLAMQFVWWRQGSGFALGKVLWIAGTWFNWYLGIVAFNSDLVFTITNVVAHGIPYFGLIALYSARKVESGGYGEVGQSLRLLQGRWLKLVIAFGVVPVLGLAFIEELFWDFLLYRQHGAFFEALWDYPVAAWENPFLRALAVAVLSLPQTVHYLLDGFIWKFNTDNPDLKTHLLGAT